MIPADFQYRDCDNFVVDEVFNKRVYARLGVTTGSRVLDLGAHVGSFSRWAISQGASHVTAVEMMPPTLEYLRKNVGNEPKITIVPAAVSSKPDEDVLTAIQWKTGNPMSAHVIGEHRGVKNINRYDQWEVKPVSLFKLLHESQATLIKFDIEGSEYDVLAPNAAALMRGGITGLIGEHHCWSQEFLDKAHWFVGEMKKAGYKADKPLPLRPTAWGKVIHYTVA